MGGDSYIGIYIWFKSFINMRYGDLFLKYILSEGEERGGGLDSKRFRWKKHIFDLKVID